MRFVLLLIVSWLGLGWTEMIVIGIYHAHWWSRIPTMGGGTAFGVAALEIVVCAILVFVSSVIKDL